MEKERIIERKEYLDLLLRLKDKRDIKVITGVRRCGKSYLMLSYIDYLKKNFKDINIIYIDLRNYDNSALLIGDNLFKYVKSKEDKNKSNYLFIDEIQDSVGFEKIVNYLYDEKTYDIYLTGSNSTLLSSEIATLFTGRYIEIKMYPFSYKEYCLYHHCTHNYESFNEYLNDGGFLRSYEYLNDSDKDLYINGIYNSIINKDLVNRYNIKNTTMFNDLSSFLLDNISNIVNPTRISNYLTSEKIKTNHETIDKYISYLTNAYLFLEAKRFDIKGNKYFLHNSKYYVIDLALRNAILGSRNKDYGRLYENVVFIELLRQGYDVSIGILRNSEIDFVAKKKDKVLYIQVAYDISNPDTLKRELQPFYSIKNNYEKLLITSSKQETYTIDGFKIVDIVNWLSNN